MRSRPFNHLSILLLSLVGSVIPVDGMAQASETQRFCSLGESLQDRHGQDIWGAFTVQHYIRELLNKPHVVDNPAASYGISYLVMTRERDQQRCGGMLAADDPQSELIGDLLADIMSRWLVLATDQCLEKKAVDASGVGICRAIQRTVARKDDTLRSALELTSVYLSSHMASALGAVILADSMWNQSFPSDTHCLPKRPCSASAMAARVRHIRKYKLLYDKNNAFLARNVVTVIETLKNACYLRKGLLTAGAPIVNELPINALLFGQLRDQTFATAIELASTIRRQNHPMLTLSKDGNWQIEYSSVRNFVETPAILFELESTARKTFSSDALGWLLKPLGGRDDSDLRRIRPSVNPSCRYPLAEER